MYHMYTVLSLIMLVSEMLKTPKPKIEAHSLKKLDFVTKKYLAQDALQICPRTTENLFKIHSIMRIVMWTTSLIFSYIPQYIGRLPRCISPYKQSLG